MANLRPSPGRLDAAEAMLQEMGGRFREFYMTMGDRGMVAIVEAPDDETMAIFALRIGALGNLRTTTLEAYEEGDYRRILSKVP